MQFEVYVMLLKTRKMFPEDQGIFRKFKVREAGSSDLEIEVC